MRYDSDVTTSYSPKFLAVDKPDKENMTPVPRFEIVLLLMAVIVVLDILARRLRFPRAAALIAGGIGFAMIPGTPDIELDPDLVLAPFLPTLLMASVVHRVGRLPRRHKDYSSTCGWSGRLYDVGGWRRRSLGTTSTALGSLLRPWRNRLAAGFGGGKSRRHQVLRPSATTDACCIGVGEPEAAPLAFVSKPDILP